jgi:UDP:flavonoid glycosyltransferase YjiC (YdhE family)
MAMILAYTSPALGHLLPISALLAELSRRGHTVHVRTLSTGVEIGQRLGFAADAIDPRIEEIEQDDWKATNPVAALKRSVAVFTHRAAHEVFRSGRCGYARSPGRFARGCELLGRDVDGRGRSYTWACFSPYTPPLRSRGVPPFGLGLKPLSGVLGRVRDAAVRIVVVGGLEKVMLPPINTIRAKVNVGPVASMDDFLRRSPLLLVASGKPFQYPQTDWGDAVQMIGPCVLDPETNSIPHWLATIEKPIVLVTTSSEKQADANLVQTAITALADEPVQVVATVPAGQDEVTASSPNATVCRFVPHGVVLDHAVCAVTHGGMGVTQKALAHGVPVCVVPYGRDQFEVARRVEVARCGTRLPAKKLSSERLRTKVREAMTMTDGARRVASGYAATGGVATGADLFEQRVLGLK